MSLRRLLISGFIMACMHSAVAETKPSNRSTDTPPAPPPTQPQAAGRTAFPEIGMQLSQTAAPPVLKKLMESDVQLVSLGEIAAGSGIVGYLAEAQDGKFQTFYLMPDGTTLIAGLAFRLVNGSPQPSLENVTARQIADMRQRLESSRQSAEESRRRAVEMAETARKRADEAAQSQRSRIEELDDRSQQADAALKQLERAAPIVPPSALGKAPTSAVTTPAVVPTAPAASVLPAPKPQASDGTSVAATASMAAAGSSQAINKDEFLAALNNGKTQWFELGAGTAPMLVMIADPRCPYCHQAWTKLAPMISAKQVRVRVVLIPANPGSEADTISLLSKQGGDEPGRSFWMGQGSADGKSIDPPPPVGSPQYAQGLEAARQNLMFVEKFGQVIRSTPFLAYVDADGRLRTGGIDNLDSFLKGLPAPSAPPASR